MEKYKYIYGASVQGIQGFIFSTNSLKDIVGGSELVEKICTSLFSSRYLQGATQIIGAAGNIKCVYDDPVKCQKTVLEFPKTVMQEAPGITISQAVVKVTEEEFKNHFSQCMDELEKKLKIQRNKPSKSMTVGYMGVERSRSTGLPATQMEQQEFLDEGTYQKRKLSMGGKATISLTEKSLGINELSPKIIALNIEDLTEKNDWIAIIHADGNGLGEVVAKFSSSLDKLKSFSTKLNEATIQAAHAAFKKVYTSENYFQKSTTLPFRPVVLGGDDMTMICKASLAIEYTKIYLQEFEEATRQKLGAENGLTACAGIAFIKSSYPFHYGYDLAETICGQAKKVSKSPLIQKGTQNPPSSLMFYKVQGSFIESYDQMLEKEKTPQKGISFNFGPYFLHPTEGYWSIEELEKSAADLHGKEGNTVKTGLRKWMSAMHHDLGQAQQAAERNLSILTKDTKPIFKKATSPVQREGVDGTFYPAADMLDLNTIINQETKED